MNAPAKSESVRIGTSGWQYSHWKGPFYPEGTRVKEFLAYYCRHFNTVEVNQTFYGLPEKHAVRAWGETVQPDFLFAVKAGRFITHMKKLKDAGAPLRKFFGRIEVLGPRLGPILFQLPPRWHVNVERLRSFLKRLPGGLRYAFEFRDPTWMTGQVYDALAEHDAAFCLYELGGYLSPKIITTDFVYVRLHGPGGPYQGRYSDRTLAGWAEDFASWVQQGRRIYCYFDNDEAGYAPRDALRLMDRIRAM